MRTSPYATFFLRAEWVESWLEIFAPLLATEILVFRAASEPVAAAVLVRRMAYYRIFPVRCVFLNTSGEDARDTPCFEFNNLLCLEGWEQPVAVALRDYLERRPWDEFRLDGFCPGPPLEALGAAFAGAVRCSTVRQDYFINLQALRETNTPYEKALGYKTRNRMRLTFRHYGQTTLETAASTDAALQMLDQLASLHQATWVERGQPGVFASSRFVAFHRALVRRVFPAAGIQMVRVSAGQQPVGLLYNMIHAGKLYCYQWGLHYTPDKRTRPGVLTVACAVQHCLTDPALAEFHFMAGAGHYKEHLTTDSNQLEWVIFQKDNWRTAAIRWLQRWYRRWKGRVPKPAADSVAD